MYKLSKREKKYWNVRRMREKHGLGIVHNINTLQVESSSFLKYTRDVWAKRHMCSMLLYCVEDLSCLNYPFHAYACCSMNSHLMLSQEFSLLYMCACWAKCSLILYVSGITVVLFTYFQCYFSFSCCFKRLTSISLRKKEKKTKLNIIDLEMCF